jgi:hypothetical protein
MGLTLSKTRRTRHFGHYLIVDWLPEYSKLPEVYRRMIPSVPELERLLEPLTMVGIFSTALRGLLLTNPSNGRGLLHTGCKKDIFFRSLGDANSFETL